MNLHIRRSIPFLLAALSLALLARADTLYLRAGEQEDGRLQSMSPDAVVFQGSGGEKTFATSDVIRVQLQRARKFDEVDTAAQITDPDLKACLEKQPSEKDYPSDGSVALLLRKVYDLTTPGVVKETHRSITKILRQRGEDLGSVSAWYFDDTDAADVDFALTVTPDGRVLHLSDTALKTESLYASLPDYRRLSRLRFACKEPRPGSVLDVQYTMTRKRDAALEPFYVEEMFQGESPVLRKEVIVIVPAASGDQSEQALRKVIAFDVDKHGADALQFTTQPESAPGEGLRLVWSLRAPQPGILDEPLMPPRREFVPTVTLARPATWDAIVKAYASALAAVPAPSEAVKAKAVELAKDGGAQAIYNFLARSLRTAPVPQLQFRVLPHSADETVGRGLANELDKNFLYLKMLEAAGIDCAFALVRDRLQGPLADNAPSLRAFSRSAVYLVKEDRFSNVSSDRVAFEDLPSDLQGSPALLITPGAASPVTTQESGVDDEQATADFDAALSADGDLELTVNYSGAGNSVVWMRAFKDLDEQQLRNQLEQLAARLHPAAVLKDYTKTDFADLSVSPKLTVKCAIPGFAFKAGDDLMLFDVPVIAYDAGDVGRPTREHDLFWGHVSRNMVTGKIALPKEFAVYSMPKNVRFDSDIVSYKAKLKKERDAITFSDLSDLKVAEALKEAYADFKKCKETRANLARERIILTRPKG